EVDDVGAQPLGGRLERDAGTGRVLEEQVHDRPAAQGRKLLDRAVGQSAQLSSGVEDEQGVVAGQVSAGQEVGLHSASASCVGAVVGAGSAGWVVISTASEPESKSDSVTCTVSLREVGRFLPTKSGRMGSSRCPRSTRTASWTARGRPTSLRASS